MCTEIANEYTQEVEGFRHLSDREKSNDNYKGRLNGKRLVQGLSRDTVLYKNSTRCTIMSSLEKPNNKWKVGLRGRSADPSKPLLPIDAMPAFSARVPEL